MSKKILYVILILVFIIALILISLFLNNKNKDTQNNKQSNIMQENNINKEESQMEVTKIGSEDFDKEVLQSDKTVLIDFYADWCGPCKSLSPIVDEVAGENSEVKFVKVNIDENQDLSRTYGVMSIPTLVVIKNGKEADRSVGLISKAKIENLIK